MTDAALVQRAVERASRWITAQRWFGDKSRTVTSLAIEHLAMLDGQEGKAAFAIVRFTFDCDDDVRYFVPVAWHDGGDELTIRDALADARFLGWLFAGFREMRVLHDGGDWVWTSDGGGRNALDEIDLHRVRPLEVEQSNSSVLFDDRIMLKVFRRLQPGINPDLEVTRYLTAEAGFRHVPALFGTLEGTFADESFVLAVLQEYVPNRGDCWGWFGGILRSLDEASLEMAVNAVGLLGQRTAEMHVALARATDDPAFVPEAIDKAYAADTLARVRQELDETASLLADSSFDPHDLARLIEGLRHRLASADALVGVLRTRIHGDYHLGQVLRTLDDDYAIIDFEGEPSRSIAQRREKASPLRDVAGMLRSLGYAAGALRKDNPSDRLLALLGMWETRARQVYLDRYRTVVGASSLPLVPEDEASFDAALHILEIEKSLYEARYEMNNRPTWLDIPMSALRHLATGDRM
ncbi:MAG: hypothetical protein QM589_12200 [Thermomicrobiales bacterium]